MTTDDGRPVLLERSGGPAIASGCEVAYMVSVAGRWIGWVYDERAWLGDRHGPRRWSAAWREHDDEHTRWRTEGHRTRQSALDALLAHIEH